MAVESDETVSTAGPAVRVNGYLVKFPDGQPFSDKNNRTMIPVRFVAEELKASVSWNGDTQTVSISKDDVNVEITIGSKELKVTNHVNSMNVAMDTQAVIKDGRTYVPIRYVAEALGAYVDYSDAFKTVGIYYGVLSPEEIKTLREYSYTQPDNTLSYEDAKSRYNSEDLAFYYGTYRDTSISSPMHTSISTAKLNILDLTIFKNWTRLPSVWVSKSFVI